MFQLHTGVPFTPVMGTANLSGSLAGTWRPNRIAKGTVEHPGNEWYDPSAFVEPASYTFGNSGRNILYSPGWKDMDRTLAKNFNVRESVRLQFTVEVFDLFNAHNFGMPNPNIRSASAGTITSANTSRLVQVGAKVRF
jgi:hypothetical protein